VTLRLPLAALVAALGLIGVQLAAGGADFAPAKPADPCRERPLGPRSDDLEPLAETVVLLGVQRAACTLGVTRERLVLALPSARDRLALARSRGRDERGLAAALTAGLDHAVDRLDRADRLPPASALLDAYAGELGLPGIAEEAVKRIPAGIVDGLLPTGAVLRRALRQIDMVAVLRDLDDPDALERTLRDRIKDAAVAEARARLIDKIPEPIRRLFGIG
jgi:hypothetical protein